jgi:hypothetical protein
VRLRGQHRSTKDITPGEIIMQNFLKSAALGLATLALAATLTAVSGIATPAPAEAGILGSIKKAAGGIAKGAVGAVKTVARVEKKIISTAARTVVGAVKTATKVERKILGAAVGVGRTVAGTAIRAGTTVLKTEARVIGAAVKFGTTIVKSQVNGAKIVASSVFKPGRISAVSAPRFAGNTVVRDHRR